MLASIHHYIVIQVTILQTPHKIGRQWNFSFKRSISTTIRTFFNSKGGWTTKYSPNTRLSDMGLNPNTSLGENHFQCKEGTCQGLHLRQRDKNMMPIHTTELSLYSPPIKKFKYCSKFLLLHTSQFTNEHHFQRSESWLNTYLADRWLLIQMAWIK